MNRLLCLIAGLFLTISIHAEPFTQKPLPYNTSALEPSIDEMTMQIHYGQHHSGYVDKLNKEVENTPQLADLSLEDIMARISDFNEAVRNNGGGHYNHQLFWEVMAPEGEGGEPSSALREAVNQQFESMEKMRAQFEEAGTSRFGSGWVWLIVDEEGELKITSTPNQDNPLMNIVDEDEQGQPILALDVWEHAYYPKYQNRRDEYLSAWWDVVNWNEVNRLFEQARS